MTQMAGHAQNIGTLQLHQDILRLTLRVLESHLIVDLLQLL